jgi:DedD protein
MAKAATDDQTQLRRKARRRLIGAMALVTLIAVVLPWILENEPKPSDQEIAIQIPSPESSSFNTRVVPGKSKDAPISTAEPTKAQVPEGGVSAAQAPESDTLKAEQDKILAAPAPKNTAAIDKPPAAPDAKAAQIESKQKPSERRDAQADGKQFVVQIAALADADKAQSIQKELTLKGLKSYTEVVKTASGDVTRVRVGPFSSRERAEQERVKLKGFGYDGNVAPR